MQELKIDEYVAYEVLDDIKQEKVKLAIKSGLASIFIAAAAINPEFNLLAGFGIGFGVGTLSTYKNNIKQIEDKYGIKINIQNLEQMKEITQEEGRNL